LGLHDDLVQRRRGREIGVRDGARQLRLELGAVAVQEQVQPAADLQEAVFPGIAVEPVEVGWENATERSALRDGSELHA